MSGMGVADAIAAHSLTAARAIVKTSCLDAAVCLRAAEKTIASPATTRGRAGRWKDRLGRCLRGEAARMVNASVLRTP